MWGWLVAYGFAGATCGCYYVWHAGGEIPIISTWGLVAADVVFPGESLVRDFYSGLMGAIPTDLANVVPCNLCDSGINIAPTTWTAEYKGKTIQCDMQYADPSYRGPTHPWSSEREACNKTRPPPQTARPVRTTNCAPVQGVNGFDTKGLNPKTYILERLFNAKAVSNGMKYNKNTFIDGSPYQCQREAVRSYNGVQFSLDKYYRQNFKSWHANDPGQNQAFVPPYMNAATVWKKFRVAGEAVDRYWAPSQINYVSPPGHTWGDTLDLINQIQNQVQSWAWITDNTTGATYFTLEWWPEGVAPLSFDKWGTKQYQTYIDKYMQCPAYSTTAQ